MSIRRFLQHSVYAGSCPACGHEMRQNDTGRILCLHCGHDSLLPEVGGYSGPAQRDTSKEEGEEPPMPKEPS